MNIERITSPHVTEPPPGRWSNALRVGDMLLISGTVSRAPDGVAIQGTNEYEQAKIIFGKIRHLVEAAGGTMSDVVKVTIYVVNIKQNTEVWRARQEFFTGNFPCSTLVEVRSLATPEILVEIEAIAYIGAGIHKRFCVDEQLSSRQSQFHCPVVKGGFSGAEKFPSTAFRI